MQTLNKTRRAMRPHSLSVRKPAKRAICRGRKRLAWMKGGPAISLWLSSPGTLPFRIGDTYGYYNCKNEWVAL